MFQILRWQPDTFQQNFSMRALKLITKFTLSNAKAELICHVTAIIFHMSLWYSDIFTRGERIVVFVKPCYCWYNYMSTAKQINVCYVQLNAVQTLRLSELYVLANYKRVNN